MPPENTTASPPMANIYNLVINPILAGGVATKVFTDTLAANLTGLGRVEYYLVRDVARRLQIPPTDITVQNVVYNRAGEIFFQMSFKEDTTGSGTPLATALSDSVSGVVTADWLNGTIAAMKEVGAAAGLDVRGAALAGVVGSTTPAPSSNADELCFINQDCIITAVAVGLGVLVLIIIVVAVCAKMCGGGS